MADEQQTRMAKVLKDVKRYYFSGSQCEISINGYFLDEVVELEISLNVEQTPIYGYASYHMDAVATGRVYAVGSLTINYVYDGYLLDYLQSSNSKLAPKTKDGIKTPDFQNNLSNTGSTEQADKIYDKISTNALADAWNDYNNKTITNGKEFIRPEFMIPFNIKIKDKRIGSGRMEDGDTDQLRVIRSAVINKFATVRRADGTPIVEVYTFIAKTIV